MNANDNNQFRRVSVVIPAYNAGPYICRTIESVLNQTHRADEIIVIDDGSTDNTGEQVKKYGSSVRYIYQDNGGASTARNTGIKAAGFEWIAFLDGDDEWLPEKLKLQIEHLGRNPQLVWTGANFYYCLCDENRRGPCIAPARAEQLLNGKEFFDDFFWAFRNAASGCTITMLIRKDILEQAGMFRVGQLMANDLDLWFRIAYQHGRFGFISEPLAIYHIAIPQSITKKHRLLEIRCELLKRHLLLSAEHGRDQAFKPCAGRMAGSWIRSLLFEDRPEDIRGMLNDFGELLSRRFKIIVRLLLIFPRATAVVCHTISRIVRALHLRRQIVPRPKRRQDVSQKNR